VHTFKVSGVPAQGFGSGQKDGKILLRYYLARECRSYYSYALRLRQGNNVWPIFVPYKKDEYSCSR
jgi:hypothetical protein